MKVVSFCLLLFQCSLVISGQVEVFRRSHLIRLAVSINTTDFYCHVYPIRFTILKIFILTGNIWQYYIINSMIGFKRCFHSPQKPIVRVHIIFSQNSYYTRADLEVCSLCSYITTMECKLPILAYLIQAKYILPYSNRCVNQKQRVDPDVVYRSYITPIEQKLFTHAFTKDN